MKNKILLSLNIQIILLFIKKPRLCSVTIAAINKVFHRKSLIRIMVKHSPGTGVIPIIRILIDMNI